MNRFLIIRLSSLGDIIHTLPAFSALRTHFPRADIAWLAEEKGKEILDLVPGLDRIFVMPLKNWPVTSKKFWVETRRFLAEIRDRERIALDFQGLVKSGLFAYLSRARERIGFHKQNLKESGASVFYTNRLNPIDENMHVISKNLKLLTKLGIEETSYNFPIDVPAGLMDVVLEKIKSLGYSETSRLLLLNVGAAWVTKRWMAENWIEFIRKLSDKKMKVYPLLLWGNETEKKIAGDIRNDTGVAMVPALTLKEVIALVKRSDLVVSGDTFVLQAACALRRPVVALFGPTNPARNGPFRSADAIAFHELECSYCYKRTCPSLKCLERITPQDVFELTLELLENHD